MAGWPRWPGRPRSTARRQASIRAFWDAPLRFPVDRSAQPSATTVIERTARRQRSLSTGTWQPECWEGALAEIEAGGGKPYAIPAGASDHPLGGLGFANWAREVEAQEREVGVFFDTIIACSVTGSTQAGMIAGFADRGRERRVIGIDASAEPAATRDQVGRIARFTATAIGIERDLRDDEIILDERYHAGTYGIPDEGTLDAMRPAARLEGMITDPVYEGKSMAGLIDLVERREIERSSTVLYAHLGGQPAINAYAALFS